MVTMLPSYWHSVTVSALVVIVLTNFSLVSSYCSDRSDFCSADNRLNRIEREVVLKRRQERGNDLVRTFRDSLRRDINDIDRIRRIDTNRFDRFESENRLRRNTRLSHDYQKRIESDEQNNRVEAATRRQNRNNLRRIETRNDVGRKSFNGLKEELIRQERVRVQVERIREALVRKLNDREERNLDRRVRNERVKELRMNEENVRKEPVHVQRIHENRVREERAREMRFAERQEPIREARQQRVVDQINRRERFGEERIRDINVRDERRNERLVDRALQREEISRRQWPNRSHNIRNNEMKERLNVNTRSERTTDREDNRRIRKQNPQSSMDDRRENRRIEVISDNRNEQRHQNRLDETVERQMNAEDRKELENRLSINKHIQNREDSRRIESRRDTSLRRDVVNDSEERGNRYNDRLSAYRNDYARDTSLKEFIHNSPQLSWNFCQAVLIAAIVVQLFKYKDGMNKSKSLNSLMNLPLMFPNRVKAL